MDVDHVGVVGLGLLGEGIAACFLLHGFRVVAIDRDQDRLLAARRGIEGAVQKALAESLTAAEGRRGEPEEGDWSSLLRLETEYECLRDCDLVVESITEAAEAKAEVFDQIERVVDPRAVLASNTSAIPISQLQEGRRHPGRCVGMHWAQPAWRTRFLEVIKGDRTDDSTLAFTLKMARRIGKEPSLCQKDIPGFIVNRIGYALYREALALLDEGVADAETIDRSVRNALGLWAALCGPLRWIDLSGGPELYARAMEPVLPTLNRATTLSPSLRNLAEAGARGIQNGLGFYHYSPEDAERWRTLYQQESERVSNHLDELFPLREE